MIVSRTPLRISFVGGGTDMAWFYKRHPGAVVSTTINKYIYITVNKKFDEKVRASYSKTEMVDSADKIKHELIRECLKLVGINKGIEITSIADVPSEGTGLGSSSSYVVGVLNALCVYKGVKLSPESLAKKACQIEIEILGKSIGKQDQYITANGGLNYFQFNPDDSVSVEPIICKPETKEKLARNLLILYTGITRSSDYILKKQKKSVINSKAKRQKMEKMVRLAKEMKLVLSRNDLTSFGDLLHENWLLNKDFADGISNDKIEGWYKKARRKGAIGGKILGAGGGGFLLLYAPNSKHKKILASLSELSPLEFSFEPQGSKIIYRDDKERRSPSPIS